MSVIDNWMAAHPFLGPLACIGIAIAMLPGLLGYLFIYWALSEELGGWWRRRRCARELRETARRMSSRAAKGGGK